MHSFFLTPYLLAGVSLLISCQIFMILYYLIRKTDTNKCPSCGNKLSGVRISRPFIIKVFLSPFVSNIRYYKCLSCYRNFFIVHNESQKETDGYKEHSKSVSNG